MHPMLGVLQQFFGRLHTGSDRSVGNRVALVIIDVALAAQGVQHDQISLGYAQGLIQCLDGRLVVPRLVGGGAPAIGPQTEHGALQDALVGRVKAVAIAHLGNARVGQVLLRRLQQFVAMPAGSGGCACNLPMACKLLKLIVVSLYPQLGFAQHIARKRIACVQLGGQLLG